MIFVTLEPLEYLYAANAGFLRQSSNIVRGRRDAHGYSGGGYDVHITGAVGEFVAAKGLGLFWAGPGTLRGHDVGVIQVRSTDREDGCLILHRDDPDGVPFVLVTGRYPRFQVRGWTLGSEGKKEKWWSEKVPGRPAFFVPQSALADPVLLVTL